MMTTLGGSGGVSEDAIQERVFAAAALRAGEKKILYKAVTVRGAVLLLLGHGCWISSECWLCRC